MRLTTPGAILLGSFVIAIAVFFGLRGRGAAVGASDPSSGVSTVAMSRSALPLPDPPPAPSSPLATGAVADATRALATQHDALMKTCWSATTQGRASFLVRAQFDDHGHQSSKARPGAPRRLRVHREQPRPPRDRPCECARVRRGAAHASVSSGSQFRLTLAMLATNASCAAFISSAVMFLTC